MLAPTSCRRMTGLPLWPCLHSYPSAILVFFNRWAAGTASAPPDYVVVYSLHHCFDVVKLRVEHLVIELWYNVRGGKGSRTLVIGMQHLHNSHYMIPPEGTQ